MSESQREIEATRLAEILIADADRQVEFICHRHPGHPCPLDCATREDGYCRYEGELTA